MAVRHLLPDSVVKAPGLAEKPTTPALEQEVEVGRAADPGGPGKRHVADGSRHDPNGSAVDPQVADRAVAGPRPTTQTATLEGRPGRGRTGR